ncbi:MAG: hypothetical protein EXX96DRAFT_476219 [Benjaminiella poitrasii]|nr:MAG: hypothetical protein EXX96DRAFT_476219 [Benjaminiella poitrasii]
MPVRRSANTTSEKKQKTAPTKEKKKPVKATLKPVKQKPVIKVTETESSPEEIVHSSWKFITAFQFFHVFRHYFQIPASFNIDKLEHALCQRPSFAFADFMAHIINTLIRQPVTNENYEDRLLTLFPDYQDRFSDLSLMDKIDVLKAIEYAHLEEENFMTFRNEITPESIRMDPLGIDYEGWSYWYFGDTRLYREIPLSNKKGSLPDFTFELVCSTVEDWHEIVKRFQPKNRTSNRELADHICEIGLEVIGKLEAREATRLKNEAKLKRAKELELIPRKRSRRLETRFEEEAKRQKLLEIERQQAELEAIERKQRLKEERLRAEQEKRKLKVEEARLKNEAHAYLSSLISASMDKESILKLRELRNQIHKKASIDEDQVVKMRRWIPLLSKKIFIEFKEGKIRFTSEENLDEGKMTRDIIHRRR